MPSLSSAACPFSFVDLFSGAGGMSCGFHAHPAFRLVAAFDGEFGKPSSGPGSLGCNHSFELNLSLVPTPVDLNRMEAADIRAFRQNALHDKDLDVLSACPPCTGFSRANPNNHTGDDPRNSLVFRTALWVEILRPRILVMENARETVELFYKQSCLSVRVFQISLNIASGYCSCVCVMIIGCNLIACGF